MKKIINTTNERIEVYIKGNTYVLEPKGSLIVPEEVCAYWRENLHEFLQEEEILEDKVEVKEKNKETEEVQEVKEVKEVEEKESVLKTLKKKLK